MLATTPFKPRLSILAAAMALSAMTGAACAAGLPSAASARAGAVLQDLGIGTPASPAQAPAARAENHGDTVSTAAKTTTASRTAKGALISGIAGDGRSHMGRNGHGAGAADRGEGSGSSGHGKGAEISTLARTTTATGAAKGATISAAASGGQSHAGEHGHGAGKATGSGHGHGHGHGAS